METYLGTFRLQEVLAGKECTVAQLQKMLIAKDDDCAAAKLSDYTSKAQLQAALENLTTLQVQNSKQNTERVNQLADVSMSLSRTQQERDHLSRQLAAGAEGHSQLTVHYGIAKSRIDRLCAC
eukprot:gene2321-8612_t